MIKFRQAILCVSVLLCATAPVLLQAHFRSVWRENEKILRAHAEQLAAWQNEQQRRTSSIPEQTLSNEETLELFRLRSEVGLLRAQTNLMEQLKNKNARMMESATSAPISEIPGNETRFAEALAKDTLQCMKNIVNELPSALDRFAREHDGAKPIGFFELKDYLQHDGRRLTGIYTFEFVRGDGPKPGDTLLLREASPRLKEGKQVRVYGFANGTAVEMSFSEDDPPGRNQLEWERQQLGLPPPTFQSAH